MIKVVKASMVHNGVVRDHFTALTIDRAQRHLGQLLINKHWPIVAGDM
jgi:hypothetical protein